jgi:hypothetical protein
MFFSKNETDSVESYVKGELEKQGFKGVNTTCWPNGRWGAAGESSKGLSSTSGDAIKDDHGVIHVFTDW